MGAGFVHDPSSIRAISQRTPLDNAECVVPSAEFGSFRNSHSINAAKASVASAVSSTEEPPSGYPPPQLPSLRCVLTSQAAAAFASCRLQVAGCKFPTCNLQPATCNSTSANASSTRDVPYVQLISSGLSWLPNQSGFQVHNSDFAFFRTPHLKASALRTKKLLARAIAWRTWR